MGETIEFKLYRDRQERQNEMTESGTYYTVQVWRSPQDLYVFSVKGDSPRWENYGSSPLLPEAEEKYYEAKEIYSKVRIIQHDEAVILGE